MVIVKGTHKARSNRRCNVPGPVAFNVNVQNRLQNIKLHNSKFKLPDPEVFDTFFWFLAERHRIHCLRVAGHGPPWTEDPILSTYSFTNVFRVFDRVTQYILRNVIGCGSEELTEVAFRVLFFRSFNSIDTWEFVVSKLGTPRWSDFDLEKYERVLELAAATNGALYNAAYILLAPDLGGQGRNYANHLRLIKLMMEQGLPKKLKTYEYLRDAHGYICLYPAVGNFIGFQYLLDLNMLPHYNWDEYQWAALGPGSKSGLEKLLGPSVRGHEESAMEFLRESLLSHFARLGIPGDNIPRLCDGRPSGLSMVDLEHSLCEYDKYCRVRFPRIKGKRTEIRKKFSANSIQPTADVPLKWMKPQPAPKLTKPPAFQIAEDGSGIWEVSRIVAERTFHGTPNRDVKRYLVRWKGWGPEDDWWMSENDLLDAQDLIKDWTMLKAGIEKGIVQMRAIVPDRPRYASTSSLSSSTDD